MDHAVVSMNDRPADRQSDADSFVSVSGIRAVLSVKNKRDLVGIQSDSIVPDCKCDTVRLIGDQKVDGIRARGMDIGIFHQVDQHLFDQSSIH